MQARYARRLRILIGVTLASTFAGAAYGGRSIPTTANVAVGAAVGAMNGLAITSLELFLQGSSAATLRSMSLALVLVLRTLVYAAVFMATAFVARSVESAVAPGSFDSGMVVAPSLPFALGVALGFNMLFVLSGLLGPRYLIALITGRYRRPRLEQRVVLFLDLHGSTQHAERLGDENFHRLLSRVFFDISEPVLATEGEIYRYVGDEIIITWPMTRGIRQAHCIECFFAIEATLVRRRDAYQREFGTQPRLRGALHAGPLIVGEVGDVKREIIMLGDTMNTAARIEDVCRTSGSNFLASGAVLEAVSKLPPGTEVEGLGEVVLRGRDQKVQLFVLKRGPG